VQVLKVLTPTQLVDQFVLHTQAVMVVHDVRHIGHREKPVREVGRELCHRAIEGVAGVRIVTRVDLLKPLLGSLWRWRKFIHTPAIVPCLSRYTEHHVLCPE